MANIQHPRSTPPATAKLNFLAVRPLATIHFKAAPHLGQLNYSTGIIMSKG